MNNSDNHRDKSTVAAGAGFSLAGRGISALLGLFFYRYLNHFLGLEQAGLLLLAFSVISLTVPLAQFGIPIGIQKFVAVAFSKKNWNKVRGAIFSSLQIVTLTTIAVIILLMIFAPEISSIFTNNPEKAKYAEKLPGIVRIYSFYLLPSVILAVLLSALRAMRKIIPTFVIDNVYTPAAWLGLVFLIGSFSYFQNKVPALIIGFICIISVGVVIAILFLKKIVPLVKIAATDYCRKELILFSTPLLFRSFLQMFLQIDKLMIGYFCSFSMIMIYVCSVALAKQSSFIMSAFASLFSPMIAELHSKGDKTGLNDLYKTVTRWCMAFALPVIVIVMLVPELLLRFLGIVDSPDACLTVRIIAVGQIMSVAVGNTGGMLVMTNYPWLTFANNVVAVILNIILNIILIPKFGIVGAAIATCIAIIVRNLAALVEVKKFLSMSPFSLSLLRVVGCVLVAGSAVILFRKNIGEIKWWLELFYCFVIFGVIYSPIMWISMHKDDKMFIMKIIKNRAKR